MGILMRAVLVVGVGLVLWKFVRKLVLARDSGGQAAESAKGGTALAPAQEMCRCAVCGLHLPKNELQWHGGEAYCDEHKHA